MQANGQINNLTAVDQTLTSQLAAVNQLTSQLGSQIITVNQTALNAAATVGSLTGQVWDFFIVCCSPKLLLIVTTTVAHHSGHLRTGTLEQQLQNILLPLDAVKQVDNQSNVSPMAC